jgi:hypothetical protein
MTIAAAGLKQNQSVSKMSHRYRKCVKEGKKKKKISDTGKKKGQDQRRRK